MWQQAKCAQQHYNNKNNNQSSSNNNNTCNNSAPQSIKSKNADLIAKQHAGGAQTSCDHVAEHPLRASLPAGQQQQQQHAEQLPGITAQGINVAVTASAIFVAVKQRPATETRAVHETVQQLTREKCPNFSATTAIVIVNNSNNNNNNKKNSKHINCNERNDNNNANSTRKIIKMPMASCDAAVSMSLLSMPTAAKRSVEPKATKTTTLTPQPPPTTTTRTTTSTAATTTTTTPQNASGNILPAPQPQRNTEKTKDFNSRRRRGRLRSRVIAPPAMWSAVNVNASRSSLSLLSSLLLLLSFVIDYYVNIKNLVLSTITSRRLRHRRRQPASSYANDADAATPPPPSAAATAAHATTPQTLTTTTTTTTTIIKEKSTRSGRMPYIYAFVLCTSILLPSGNNFAAAAKPKSATQLQHKTHQHDQQQTPPQHVAGVTFDGNGVGVLTPPSYQVVSGQASNEDADFSYPSAEIFDSGQSLDGINEADDDQNAAYETQRNDTHNDSANVTKSPLFPKDLFTKEQLENGAVVFHIIGVIYMFVALAIVCDEFFVPSLDVIIEKLDITDDVAGATFMAAGGSAPELFTSVIGVFISFDDVGIGTIVGSAVFNILFVIGMCALFSRTILTLTWWPLFRDCTFYSISLMVLIYFFRDNFIYWWEALILFSIYMAYVTFMKWNVQVERCVKKLITKNKVTRVRSTDQLMPAGNAANSSETSMATQPGGSVTSRAASESRSGPPGSSSGAGATGNSSGTAGSTQTPAKFRHGLLQLMIHTIDPLHDDDVPGKVDEKATQLHAIASLKVLLDATKPQRGGATTSAANHVKINLKETTLADRPNGNIDTTLDSPSLSGRRPSWIEQRVKIQTRKFSIKTHEVEDEPEPLSMAWPDTARKRLTYVLVAPLLIPMWLTLPDTRTPRGKKYFPVTFIGSIVWIAIFSYLMVWWANVAGDTAGINPEVMGLTFLAAGTSIPDLITSVIVARKGFGDMAVSSSVGSNIFDVTVGLPVPWLLFGIIYGAPVEVNSVGMVCSITILFMMLIFVVMSIACFHWRMNKGLGFTMFLLYFVFVAVSLMFEYHYIDCPV